MSVVEDVARAIAQITYRDHKDDVKRDTAKAKAAIEALAANVSDEMVHAFQNELARQLGTTYTSTSKGLDYVRAALPAAILAAVKP